jgi:hypothetical protein
MTLWDAGQRRVVREGRERLAELYVGVRDGYVAGNVATGKARWSGGDHIPSYVRPERSSSGRGLAQLMRDFPGNIAPGSEFTH